MVDISHAVSASPHDMSNNNGGVKHGSNSATAAVDHTSATSNGTSSASGTSASSSTSNTPVYFNDEVEQINTRLQSTRLKSQQPAYPQHSYAHQQQRQQPHAQAYAPHS